MRVIRHWKTAPAQERFFYVRGKTDVPLDGNNGLKLARLYLHASCVSLGTLQHLRLPPKGCRAMVDSDILIRDVRLMRQRCTRTGTPPDPLAISGSGPVPLSTGQQQRVGTKKEGSRPLLEPPTPQMRVDWF